jgi:single-stranded-DNA-specific exonuclease
MPLMLNPSQRPQSSASHPSSADVGVCRSDALRWVDPQFDELLVEHFVQALSISSTLARLVVRLGFTDLPQTARFLAPKLSDLSAPEDVINLSEAIVRLTKSLERKEKVVILGDYDVDGITATTLLVLIMRRLGLNPDYIVPRRLEEGYGMSQAVIDRALKEYTPQVFIAVDCGTNAIKEVAFLREKGVDVIILDHHRATQGIPRDAILVNPHVHDDPHAPWLHLCAVGIVFKLIHGWIKHLRQEKFELAYAVDLKLYLDLVAMGTVADLVPLQGENRILVRHGLKALTRSMHPGVQALLDVSGIHPSYEMQPSDISFKLGPRINASGRLADARLPLEMLLSNDLAVAHRSASELNILNRQRQDIERIIAHEAELLVEREQSDAPAIMVYNPSWHSGVVGIVAGRLCRKFHRPAIVLGVEHQGLAKGSGRGIPGVNLVEALKESAHFLESWGGHPMAVGVSLKPENLDAFQKKFNESIIQQLQGAVLEPTLDVSVWLNASELNEDLLQQMSQLWPFGEANPEPILAIRDAVIVPPIVTFGENHYRFFIKTPQGPLSGVAWNRAQHLPPSLRPIEIAGKFNWSHWNGRKIAQFELLSWRLPDTGP